MNVLHPGIIFGHDSVDITGDIIGYGRESPVDIECHLRFLSFKKTLTVPLRNVNKELNMLFPEILNHRSVFINSCLLKIGGALKLPDKLPAFRGHIMIHHTETHLGHIK